MTSMEGKPGRVLLLGMLIALAFLGAASLRRGSGKNTLDEIAEEARKTRSYFES
jgi:hypothetical protein